MYPPPTNHIILLKFIEPVTFTLVFKLALHKKYHIGRIFNVTVLNLNKKYRYKKYHIGRIFNVTVLNLNKYKTLGGYLTSLY